MIGGKNNTESFIEAELTFEFSHQVLEREGGTESVVDFKPFCVPTL